MLARTLILVSICSMATASRFLTRNTKILRPDPQGDCCMEGVTVCSQLSHQLGIPDLGCEVLCRSQGFPGSLGCEYSGQVPACGCRNDGLTTTVLPAVGDAQPSSSFPSQQWR